MYERGVKQFSPKLREHCSGVNISHQQTASNDRMGRAINCMDVRWLGKTDIFALIRGTTEFSLPDGSCPTDFSAASFFVSA